MVGGGESGSGGEFIVVVVNQKSTWRLPSPDVSDRRRTALFHIGFCDVESLVVSPSRPPYATDDLRRGM